VAPNALEVHYEEPVERAFGDVPDKCTRNHQRKRIEDLIWDVEQHLSTNGPWHYQLSHLYDTPAVTAAVERITQKQQLQRMAGVSYSHAAWFSVSSH
jgi:hypothetical protein